MYDWEKWLQPLPAVMVCLSSLRAGSSLEFLKITLSSLGGKLVFVVNSEEKSVTGVQGSSPLWLGALMCPFDVPALRQLEKIIRSRLKSPGWSRGCSTIAYRPHIPNVNTFPEVGCCRADPISKGPPAQPASKEHSFSECLSGGTLLSGN